MMLAAADFSDFFQAVHGVPPLPWQRRLAAAVLAEGWPGVLSLPTASGKTAVLDIAVFALAAQAHLPAAERTACRRIALVVDRRIVVDDASRRAERIRGAIAGAAGGILGAVRAALQGLAGAHAEPLQVATLRGGIYREDAWAKSPRQPVLLCSTVDQIGSRLLHRGYGVSPRTASIHAGLLGNDCCIILDEAHISEPFRQTLGWIARYRQHADIVPVTPFRVVTMTATPRGETQPFLLDEGDRAHAVPKPRLEARKEAVLVAADKADRELTKAGIASVRAVLAWRPDAEAKPVGTVLVVLNRVASARALHRALTVAKKPPVDADVILLTGRSRAVERDRLLARWRDHIMAGREPRDSVLAKPLIVVATQCVEVGADLDLDALVTEACSLDALRQRLGRVDRLGRRGRSPVQVIIRADGVGTAVQPASDPIYGEALSCTWHWLSGLPSSSDGSRDLGIAGLEPHLPAPGGCSPPASNAPIIFPAYCDLWAQTGPEPAHSPDPAIFLHGPQRQTAEVRLVWRADLGDDSERWAAIVAGCPPVTAEGLPLPLHVARAWLTGADGADQGGDAPETVPVKDPEPGSSPRMVLRWRGPDDSEVVGPEDLLPGDVLVLPCGHGGCDGFGWNPEAVLTDDLADAAQIAARRPAVLRLCPALLERPGYAALPAALRTLAEWGPEWPDDWRQLVRDALAATESIPGDLGDIIRTLVEGGWTSEPHPVGIGMIITGRRRLGLPFTDEDHLAAVDDRPRALIPHLQDVESWASHHGEGLPDPIRRDLALAGRLHDLGKADPRFQAWLSGGDPIAAVRQGLLAKSLRLSPGSAAVLAARERAGYPVGGRHELLSVRLAESCAALKAQAHDWDLVLHLVASHHGHCRPFAPVVVDERPLVVRLDLDGQHLEAGSATGLEHLASGVAERFWALIRRYGWWGLSYLEACLRLADHRASELPGEEMRP